MELKHTARNLINIARNEVGYCEKASESDLDNPGGNSGAGNWTKYARDLHEAGYYQADKNGYEWCDVFVDWCFYRLCEKDGKLAQQIHCQSGPYGAGCFWSCRYFRDANRFSTDPNPGDQIFFGPEGDSHTGIVAWVTAAEIGTIEGNSNNRVEIKSYSRTDPKIFGFGHPRFDPEDNGRFQCMEEIPDYARQTVAKLSDLGFLVGKNDGLDLSEDMLRLMVANDRAGCYDRHQPL